MKIEELKYALYCGGVRPNGVNIVIAIEDKTIQRLSGTCFRGRGIRNAGNFIYIANFQQLLSQFRDEIEWNIQDAIEGYLQSEPHGNEFRESFSLLSEDDIGWSSTDNVKNYHADDLQFYQPKDHWRCQRVRPESGHLAKLTKEVTVVCNFKYRPRTAKLADGSLADPDGRDWFAYIGSIYPGHDIGELDGDMTKREGIVMFGWDHPGEPLPGEPSTLAA